VNHPPVFSFFSEQSYYMPSSPGVVSLARTSVKPPSLQFLLLPSLSCFVKNGSLVPFPYSTVRSDSSLSLGFFL